MLQIFHQGGPLMYPILFCSILALAIFLERLWTFLRFRRGAAELVREVESLLESRRYAEAGAACQRDGSPIGRVLLAALRNAGYPRDQVKEVTEEAGRREVAPLERYLGLLATIATISPLLGLLGTVLGMIQAFNVIAAQGVGTPATLGGGISQALITTAAGLAVAIPTILLHKYLTGRLDRLVLQVEAWALHIVDLLGKPEG